METREELLEKYLEASLREFKMHLSDDMLVHFWKVNPLLNFPSSRIYEIGKDDGIFKELIRNYELSYILEQGMFEDYGSELRFIFLKGRALKTYQAGNKWIALLKILNSLKDFKEDILIIDAGNL